MPTKPPVQHSTIADRRRRAVELRLAGSTLQQIRQQTGLSAPTVISAYKAFLCKGWTGIVPRPRGRQLGEGRVLSAADEAELVRHILEVPLRVASASPTLWTRESVRTHSLRQFGQKPGVRAMDRLFTRIGLDLQPMAVLAQHDPGLARWRDTQLTKLTRQAQRQNTGLVWVGQVSLPTPFGARRLLLAQTLRGSLAWLPLQAEEAHRVASYTHFLERLDATWPNQKHVLLHGVDLQHPALQQWLDLHPDTQLRSCPVGPTVVRTSASGLHATASHVRSAPTPSSMTPSKDSAAMRLTHLQRLEAESIHILREVVAECERPVMLYSIGKDSATMLHLARKAFYPAPPPFPLLHVDTTWKFRDMYALRDRMATESGMELLVWHNPEAKAMGINPFDHGSQIHTDMWKTQGLKQALDHHGFDAAFGGARRDEEKSRAKERVFSFRSTQHRWDPKAQRPELWNLYNAHKHKGESIRVFPISNWTELDIWQYIYLENIPIVPLYFAKERPVVERDGALLMVDDERFQLEPDELPVMRKIRFRTLGCYPLSGAIESDADTLPAIIQEMLLARTSERQGRMIDHDQAASMEKKKQEGYF
jgi:sulfate adenylyltransferase subunit 2